MSQVLKYQPGQKYEEHWDWFEEEERKKRDIDDTNRIATILVYLSGEHTPGQSCMIHFEVYLRLAGLRRLTSSLLMPDVEEGGETAFSKSEWLNETAQRAAVPSECAHAKVFVKPRKGDALLFWDLKPDGQTGDK